MDFIEEKEVSARCFSSLGFMWKHLGKLLTKILTGKVFEMSEVCVFSMFMSGCYIVTNNYSEDS